VLRITSATRGGRPFRLSRSEGVKPTLLNRSEPYCERRVRGMGCRRHQWRRRSAVGQIAARARGASCARLMSGTSAN